MLDIAERIVAFAAGSAIVIGTFLSAVRTFVLPRSSPTILTRVIFLTMRDFFSIFEKRAATYEQRDRILALYAPLSLLVMPPVWLMCMLTGFMGMFWAIGGRSWYEALRISGSSLLTLGFVPLDRLADALLGYSEATLGLILVALLIAYLPSMYSAFQKRETAVTLLEVRAGAPPSAIELFQRFQRLGRMEKLSELWISWEIWFAELEESHTSLPALAFFRSPKPSQSWITAAGTVLDAAALAASTLDIPRDVQADLCIRAGYLALRRICDFFALSYNLQPAPGDPISVTREEFEAACEQLAGAGVPLKLDREQAWRDFSGWRVNYDTPLLLLATTITAPPALWSSDRAPKRRRPPTLKLGK
jgi:hypothetical protein